MKKKSLIIFIISTLILFFVVRYFFPSILPYISIKQSQKLLKKYNIAPQSDSVNIVAITDSNYVMPLNVTMYSAIKNKNKDSKYHFYIIGIGLNNNEVKNLIKQSTDDAKITVIQEKNIYRFYQAKNKINPHVPNCDFLKFNLPQIFPKFDKILYLDGDIIVQSDLSELYNTNIENEYAGCVQENFIYGPLEAELQIPKYFNNGVMLLNLKNMRRDDISNKMLKYRIFHCPKRFVTQDTFNVVLQPKLKFLDEKYNIITLDIDTSKYSDVNQYLKSGVIIHYAGKDKPWNSEVLYGSEWHKYKNEFQSKYGE